MPEMSCSGSPSPSHGYVRSCLLARQHQDRRRHGRLVRLTVELILAKLSRLEERRVLPASSPGGLCDDALAIRIGELHLVVVAVGDEDAQHDRIALLHRYEGRVELITRDFPPLRSRGVGLCPQPHST